MVRDIYNRLPSIQLMEALGGLNLTRALGDFQYKQNTSLNPEDQIITANPDVTAHDITGEDEFLILACDGMLYYITSCSFSHVYEGVWDCLTSQQAVDFVRLKISEGSELRDIGGMICDHCLAPDTKDGRRIGCDNMTVLIVAILNGRTEGEWYSWITDRVKQHYGYETPDALPQLYSQDRLKAFKVEFEKRKARAARDRMEVAQNGIKSEPLSTKGAVERFTQAETTKVSICAISYCTLTFPMA